MTTYIPNLLCFQTYLHLTKGKRETERLNKERRPREQLQTEGESIREKILGEPHMETEKVKNFEYLTLTNLNHSSTFNLININDCKINIDECKIKDIFTRLLICFLYIHTYVTIRLLNFTITALHNFTFYYISLIQKLCKIPTITTFINTHTYLYL